MCIRDRLLLMSLLEEALLLQRAAHDLMYLGMDGSPIYSDDSVSYTHLVSRIYPSPLGPKPTPGVPTTLASYSICSVSYTHLRRASHGRFPGIPDCILRNGCHHRVRRYGRTYQILQ